MSKQELRVLSLGAGVQSTCLALMAARGEIQPMPDYAIFADTCEPKHVYDHLKWLEGELPFPIITVKHGDIWEDVLRSAKDGGRVSNPPFYTKGKDGSKGILRRTCTLSYKIMPILKEVRRLLGYAPRQRVKDAHVEQWIGISTDEMTRMKEAPEKYIENRWPLIELGMSRHACREWLKANDFPQAPRSACIFCPYHNNDYWRWLKNEHAEEFELACQFDEQIRDGIHGTTCELYLHSDLVPLREVDLRTDVDKGQLTFLDECDGVCML